MREALVRGKDRYSPHLLTLLENRINTCEKLLKDLKAQVELISPEIIPIHEKMISILRSMAAANTRSKVSLVEVRRYNSNIVSSFQKRSLRAL